MEVDDGYLLLLGESFFALCDDIEINWCFCEIMSYNFSPNVRSHKLVFDLIITGGSNVDGCTVSGNGGVCWVLFLEGLSIISK